MSAKSGEFKSHEEWFERQFGKRPTTIDPYRLLMQIRSAEAELSRLRELKSRSDVWDEQWRASSYAWQVFGGRLGR